MDDRYSAQTVLDQIGPEGQKKLARASVVVVGAGGLGCPVLTYLVAAGVGRVGMIDADTVSLGNLNRQFLHSEADIGRPKVVSAREKLTAINSSVEIVAHEEFVTDDNAETLLAGYDVVLGAVDSLETRSVINRAAAALGLPYIDGGVNGFCGSVIFSLPKKTPCLNCVFPNGGTKRKAAGVVGATAGVVGSLQANVALMWLLDRRNPIEGKLLFYDGLSMSVDVIDIKRDVNCPICGGGAI